MKKIVIVFMVLVMCSIFSCKTSDETTPPQLRPPSIVSFTVDYTELFKGQSAILSWNVSYAVTIEIDNGIGAVAASGTKIVKPASTTTYTLTARNNDGSVQKSVKIDVRVTLVSYKKLMKSYGCPYIHGTIKNIGDEAIYNVKISWAAYNNSNTIIDTASGFPADLGTIPSGVSATFDAVFFDLTSWTQVDHLMYTIDWLNGAGIREFYQETVR